MDTMTNPLTTVKAANGGDKRFSPFGLFLKYFGAYGMIIIIMVGLVGNLLTIYIFIRKRKRTGPVALYFVCLAISDCGNLVMGLQTWFHNGLFYITDGQVNIPSGVSDVACKIRVYIWNVFVAMSGYTIVAFSFERSIAVWLPLKAGSLFTTSRRYAILLVLLVLCVGTLFPYFIQKKVAFEDIAGVRRQLCGSYNMPETKFYIDVVSMVNLILPCLLILVLNILIIVGIKRAQNNDLSKSSTKTMDSKIVFNLLIIAFIYILTMGAYTAFRLVQLAAREGIMQLDAAGRKLIGELTTLASNFIVVNYSVNFVIYALSLDFYRETLCKIFSAPCGRKPVKTTQLSMTVSSAVD